jgi:glycosyltransferase involved in cell wall biosynthesis
MRILYVCSGNFKTSFDISQVFIHELIEELKEIGVESEVFLINGKGYWGYFKSIIRLWIKLIKNRYDLVHAFYGLSGLVANLQIIKPVVITFLGSDINNEKEKFFSKTAFKLSKYSIFVEKTMVFKLGAKKGFSIIPFGIDLNVFSPMDKQKARQLLGYGITETLVVFSSSFDNKAKNFPLAKKAIELSGRKVKLIELGRAYTREELATIYNASDVLLMTSFHEGSPQTIKEAMACNCPIVTTDVGDVKNVIDNTEGCYITSFDPEDVATKLNMAFEFGRRTNGNQKIQRYDNKLIANQVFHIYQQVLKIICK